VEGSVQLLVKRSAGHQRFEPTLPPNLLKPHSRRIRIDWHIAGSRFHNPEDRRDRFWRLVKVEPDAVAAANSAADQEVRDLAAEAIELAIIQSATYQPYRLRFGLAASAFGQKLMQKKSQNVRSVLGANQDAIGRRRLAEM
jgi:hypothetical protein